MPITYACWAELHSSRHLCAPLTKWLQMGTDSVHSQSPKTHNQHTMRCARNKSLPFVGESQPLVAVGTCQSFGEDYPGTGRVLFFEITRKPAEGSEAEEQWDSNMIYSRYTATPTMQGRQQTCRSSMAMLCV